MKRKREPTKVPVGNYITALSILFALAAAIAIPRLLPEVLPGPEGGAPPLTGNWRYETLENGELHRGELILTNGEHPYYFPEEQELVNISQNQSNSYFVADKSLRLGPVAMEALNRMLDAFYAEKKLRSVNVISGYRTYVYQEKLLGQYTWQMGKAEAETWAARPGVSEHHTGYVVDLGLIGADGQGHEYNGRGAYAWINENCQDYGFVVRYEADKEDLTGIRYEPWHFRYVGVPHASLMVKHGLCLEEYTEWVKSFPFEGKHLFTVAGGQRYEVYYVPKTEGDTEVPVPTDASFCVSGNNVDGFVVTIERT